MRQQECQHTANKIRPHLISMLGVLLIAVLTLAGCEERETTVLFDRDVLVQYIYDSEEGRELFRTDNLFLEDPFQIPFDDAAYRVLVDSMQRSIEVTVFVDSVRFDSVNRYSYILQHDYDGSLGILWDAEAIVDDRFFVSIHRMTATDTTVRSEVRLITRYGYFLKLGTDSQPFLGWKLWGYNGGRPEPPIQMIVKPGAGGTSFRGDTQGYEKFRYKVYFENITTGETDTTVGFSRFNYRRVDQLGVIDENDDLYLTASGVPDRSYYQIVSALTEEGFRQEVMTRSDSATYVDTIDTPVDNLDNWNLLFMQEIRRFYIPGGTPPDTIGTNWFGWCVPYRVRQ